MNRDNALILILIFLPVLIIVIEVVLIIYFCYRSKRRNDGDKDHRSSRRKESPLREDVDEEPVKDRGAEPAVPVNKVRPDLEDARRDRGALLAGRGTDQRPAESASGSGDAATAAEIIDPNPFAELKIRNSEQQRQLRENAVDEDAEEEIMMVSEGENEGERESLIIKKKESHANDMASILLDTDNNLDLTLNNIFNMMCKVLQDFTSHNKINCNVIKHEIVGRNFEGDDLTSPERIINFGTIYFGICLLLQPKVQEKWQRKILQRSTGEPIDGDSINSDVLKGLLRRVCDKYVASIASEDDRRTMEGPLRKMFDENVVETSDKKGLTCKNESLMNNDEGTKDERIPLRSLFSRIKSEIEKKERLNTVYEDN